MENKFDNKDRRRYYGLRIGDTVSAKGVDGKEFKKGDVIDWGVMDNNAVYLKFEDGTESKWVAEWCEIITKVEDKKPKRPDLSFFTQHQFKTMDEFEKFCENATDDQARQIENAIVNLPGLIAIAEMFFDGHPNPNSIPFDICLKTLNSIANERRVDDQSKDQ